MSPAAAEGYVPLNAASQTGAALVTIGAFALFVRREEYFDDRYWQHGGRPVAGGDEVLRRIGHRPGAAHCPVRRVTWFEAAAFCLRHGGRLPYLEELVEREAPALAAARQSNRNASARTLRLLHPLADLPEWCMDWFHPGAIGPGVRPVHPPRRRISGGQTPCALPMHYDAGAGFRVIRLAGRNAMHEGTQP